MGWIGDKLAGLRRLLVDGLPLPQRQSLNFTGGGFVCTDNPALQRTDVSLGPGAAAPYYTGHSTPTEVGTFGVDPGSAAEGDQEAWAAGPVWVEYVGVLRTAANAERFIFVGTNEGKVLEDGDVIVAGPGTFDGGSVTLPDGSGPRPHPGQRGRGLLATIDVTGGAPGSSITIVCPPGHTIGGQPADTDYVVPEGAVVSIRACVVQTKWAVQTWTA